MSSYILSVNERIASGKILLDYLKSLSKIDDYVCIMPHKENPMNGLDEAIEDIKKGRVTTYENAEEYKKAMHKMLEYV